MVLKILNIPLVLFGILHRIEGAQVPALVRVGINFPGVNAVLTRFQFPDHSRLMFTIL